MTDFGTPGSFPTPPAPPMDTRTGPPWELPGAFVQRWLDTAKMILLDPMNGFSTVRRTGGLGAPLTYYAIGAAPAILATVLFQMIGLGGSMMTGDPSAAMAGGIGMVGLLVMLVLVFFVGFFIGTGIVHLVLSLLGGAKYGYEATARTFAYAYGSAWPIAIVPFCGGFIAGIWALVCTIMGLANMQETTPVKAAIAIFTPGVICCILWFIAAAAIMTMIGISGAAMSP